MEDLLKVRGLTASAGDTTILHDIDLTIRTGETHVLMGPNGAGKSTLGHVVMGNPEYTVQAGSIEFAGRDIADDAADARSRAGLFLSFQAPVEVPGVPKRYKERVAQVMEQLDMDPATLNRELNVGFSGGEKKKVEMLQLLLLQPRLAILDETDSGLDVDALTVVSRAISIYRETCDGSLLIITHQKRLLEHLDVDHAHVMVAGRLVESGDARLVDDVNRNGYERFTKAGA